MKGSGNVTVSGDENAQTKLTDKEMNRKLNRKITEIDKENSRMLEEINKLEKDYELLRSKRELQTKKLEESGVSSGFFGFAVLVIIAIFILLK